MSWEVEDKQAAVTAAGVVVLHTVIFVGRLFFFCCSKSACNQQLLKWWESENAEGREREWGRKKNIKEHNYNEISLRSS